MSNNTKTMKTIILTATALMLTACDTNPSGDTRHYTDYSTYTAVTPSGRHVECISDAGITCDWENAQ